MAKSTKFAASLSNSDIALARKFEAARLTTFSQAVKAFERDDSDRISQWKAELREINTYVTDVAEAEELAYAEDAVRFPVIAEVVVEEAAEVVTIGFQQFDMDMTAQTTDAEIEAVVAAASIYEFDREDKTAAQVQATIDETVAGLIRARDEAFGEMA